MVLINYLLIAVVSFFAFSCALTPQIEYRNVDIPVKCNLTIPTMPNLSNNSSDLLNNLNLYIIFTNELNQTLHACEGK